MKTAWLWNCHTYIRISILELLKWKISVKKSISKFCAKAKLLEFSRWNTLNNSQRFPDIPELCAAIIWSINCFKIIICIRLRESKRKKLQQIHTKYYLSLPVSCLQIACTPYPTNWLLRLSVSSHVMNKWHTVQAGSGARAQDDAPSLEELTPHYHNRRTERWYCYPPGYKQEPSLDTIWTKKYKRVILLLRYLK